MFTLKQIKPLLHERPFKPFRICLTDGRTFDVAHPELVLATTHCVEVGIDLNSDGDPQNVARCAMLHIVGIDDITAERPA